jgi:hypothetical protein
MTSDDLSAPQITCLLVLAGDEFDSDACTATVGLTPTSVWKQEREDLRTYPGLDNMNWCFGFEKVRSHSVDEVVCGTLDSISTAKDRIVSFARAQKLSLTISCRVTIEVDRPVYDLPSNTVQRLADLGAGFSLDIYDYSE